MVEVSVYPLSSFNAETRTLKTRILMYLRISATVVICRNRNKIALFYERHCVLCRMYLQAMVRRSLKTVVTTTAFSFRYEIVATQH